MCAVSNVGDAYYKRWTIPQPHPQPIPQPWPQPSVIAVQPPITRAEFDALRAEVLEMKELLRAAKAEDVANGTPDCEMADKLEVLRAVAKMVGVDLEDVLAASLPVPEDTK